MTSVKVHIHIDESTLLCHFVLDQNRVKGHKRIYFLKFCILYASMHINISISDKRICLKMYVIGIFLFARVKAKYIYI